MVPFDALTPFRLDRLLRATILFQAPLDSFPINPEPVEDWWGRRGSNPYDLTVTGF